jgi:SNF2 family DNA or RNA helicase
MDVSEHTRVRVRYRPDLGAGEIFRVFEKHGEYLADVVFEKDGKRILETIPRDHLQPVPDIFERYKRGDSDHPHDFFLKQLSYQFPLENSGGKLSNSKTDLLPHQILLTNQIVNGRRRRFLIADEVGLGKTIEVGMIIRELVSRGEARRILIICPAGLTANWRKELKECFRVYFDVFGEDFTDASYQAWERHKLVVVSIDTLKKPQRLEKMMMGPDWDLIVFDEAHHLTRKKYGKKVDATQNYRLAERVKGKTRDLFFLTATPHQGDAFQFWSLIQLLDDQLFEAPDAMQENRGLLSRVMFRRTKREVTDVQGNPIFMRRQVTTQKFQLSMREQKFYDKLTEYLKEGYNAAGFGQDRTTKQQRAVGFVMATFQKIMSSSPRAIKQALRRRLIALYARKQMALESGFHGKLSKPEVSAKIVHYQELMRRVVADLLSFTKGEIDYTEADAYITALKQRLRKRPKFEEEVTQWALDAAEAEDEVLETEANIPNEEEKVRELIDLVDERADRKFDTLIRAIEELRREKEDEKMIVFTQYLETLYFLQGEMGKYYPPEKITILKGGPLEEKIAACESFWNENGAQFLLSTTAGGEGINLQVCRILFNYDLPWNPMAVEQRIGRIHRYGQMETAQVYNMVAEGTIEEKVYAILEEKLLEIARTIGKVDVVTGEATEDFRSEILGFLGSSTNYQDLYREALVNRDYDRTAKEITEAIAKAKEASEALRQLTQDLSTFNLEHYKQLEGKFTLDDLKAFTEKAILRLGGSFIPSGDIVQITTPEALKKYSGVGNRYDNATFSRKIATRKKNLDLLGLGHPLMDALIDYMKGEGISGEVLIAKCDGLARCASARYVFTVEFEEGTKRDLYRNFVVDGTEGCDDLIYLQNATLEACDAPVKPELEIQSESLIRNEEAKIRSTYDGVMNIRNKCVGIEFLY